MIARKNISLKEFNTFGLDYKADWLIQPESTEEISLFFRAGRHDYPDRVKVIGGGSNLLFTSDFHGTLVKPLNSAIRKTAEDDQYIYVNAGAGLTWDNMVEWAVENGYGGLENLSYIPGTVGASPVQNIGAYGVEAADVISGVGAVSAETGETVQFSQADCRFAYRYSIFKGELRDKFVITDVTFRLQKVPQFKLSYGFLEAETAALGDISLKNIRKAVIKIRKEKLPDPAETGNAGSFFKNPVISREKADDLKYNYPLAPLYDNPAGGVKIAAGWLIEQAGWKGRRIGDAGVHAKQALVIVNHGSATGKELYDLSQEIKKSVNEKFGIELEMEVEVVGSI